MAGRKCSVCLHPKRQQIDAELVLGGRQAAVSARFGISPDAVGRHARSHLPPGAEAVTAPGAFERSAPEGQPDLLGTMQAAMERLLRVIEGAEKAKQGTVLINACRELRQTVETDGRLTGAIRADGSLLSQGTSTTDHFDEDEIERLLAKGNALAGRARKQTEVE